MEKLLIKSNGQWSLEKAKKTKFGKYDLDDYSLHYDGIHHGQGGISHELADLRAGKSTPDTIDAHIKNMPDDDERNEYRHEAWTHSYSLRHKKTNQRIGGVDLELGGGKLLGLSHMGGSPGDPDDEEDDAANSFMEHVRNLAHDHAKSNFSWDEKKGQPGHPEYNMPPKGTFGSFYPKGISLDDPVHNKKMQEENDKLISDFRDAIQVRHNNIQNGTYKVADWNKFKPEQVSGISVDTKDKRGTL